MAILLHGAPQIDRTSASLLSYQAWKAMNKGERIIGYDVMRIIAAAMVVCIHSNVYFLGKAGDTAHWLTVMIATALCVVSVPLFFMVSGAGNLVKDDIISTHELFRRKIPKIFLPFVIWSVIYVLVRICAGKIDGGLHPFVSLLWEPAYYQFWFMYSLLGMYLLLPIFQYLIIKMDKRLLQYIIVFWIVSSLVLPMLVRYLPGFRLSSHFNLVFLEGYWGYFFLGGYLRKYKVQHERTVAVGLLVGGLIITLTSAVLEWHFTPSDRYYGYVYCAYLLPGAAMMTVGLFLLLQRLSIKDTYKKTIYYFSGLTMGVFYIHTMLINGYEMLFRNVAPTALNALVKFVVIVVVATLACMLLKSIKPLRKYLL
ncbi:MAG: acyltransferase family protein [Muribaculaceae bacterium]|nr:acyltransferase family protein [Muribaculaceae bacterium]